MASCLVGWNDVGKLSTKLDILELDKSAPVKAGRMSITSVLM
jgi:hypothetical protein